MKKGEKAVLTIKPEYGYSEEGSPPTIPANATLQFEVELLSWNSVKDITPAKDGGIIKTVVTEGEGWASPKDNDEVLGNLNVKFACLMCMLEWLVIIRAKYVVEFAAFRLGSMSATTLQFLSQILTWRSDITTSSTCFSVPCNSFV